MTTRMSGTSGRCSMWLAVAFVMAMSSTLSAQLAATGGLASPSSASAAACVKVDSFAADANRATDQIHPPFVGTCGTDCTPPTKPLRSGARDHMVLAGKLAVAMKMFPGHLGLTYASYRLWIASTVDVLPPG